MATVATVVMLACAPEKGPADGGRSDAPRSEPRELQDVNGGGVRDDGAADDGADQALSVDGRIDADAATMVDGAADAGLAPDAALQVDGMVGADSRTTVDGPADAALGPDSAPAADAGPDVSGGDSGGGGAGLFLTGTGEGLGLKWSRFDGAGWALAKTVPFQGIWSPGSGGALAQFGSKVIVLSEGFGPDGPPVAVIRDGDSWGSPRVLPMLVPGPFRETIKRPSVTATPSGVYAIYWTSGVTTGVRSYKTGSVFFDGSMWAVVGEAVAPIPTELASVYLPGEGVVAFYADTRGGAPGAARYATGWSSIPAPMGSSSGPVRLVATGAVSPDLEAFFRSEGPTAVQYSERTSAGWSPSIALPSVKRVFDVVRANNGAIVVVGTDCEDVRSSLCVLTQSSPGGGWNPAVMIPVPTAAEPHVMRAVVLAAGVFSADAELVFSTMYTPPTGGEVTQMFHARLINGTWTTPARMLVNDENSPSPVRSDGRALSMITLR